MARNEAVILPVNCVSAHKTYYARYDYAYDEVWVLSYGLKEVPSDGVGSSVSGIAKIDISNSRTGPQYKCPYCGNRMFVRCGKSIAIFLPANPGSIHTAFLVNSSQTR